MVLLLLFPGSSMTQPHLNRLLSALVSGLSGRTWAGKVVCNICDFLYGSPNSWRCEISVVLSLNPCSKQGGEGGRREVTLECRKWPHQSHTSPTQRESNIVRILEFAKEYFYMLRERSLYMRGGGGDRWKFENFHFLFESPPPPPPPQYLNFFSGPSPPPQVKTSCTFWKIIDT